MLLNQNTSASGQCFPNATRTPFTSPTAISNSALVTRSWPRLGSRGSTSSRKTSGQGSANCRAILDKYWQGLPANPLKKPRFTSSYLSSNSQSPPSSLGVKAASVAGDLSLRRMVLMNSSSWSLRIFLVHASSASRQTSPPRMLASVSLRQETASWFFSRNSLRPENSVPSASQKWYANSKASSLRRSNSPVSPSAASPPHYTEISSKCSATSPCQAHSRLSISPARSRKRGLNAKSSCEATRTRRSTSGLRTLGAGRLLGTSLSRRARQRRKRKSRQEIRKDYSRAESRAVSQGQKCTVTSLTYPSPTRLTNAFSSSFTRFPPSPCPQHVAAISSTSSMLRIITYSIDIQGRLKRVSVGCRLI